MSRLLRIALMWLLAFAVPAQGLAAATMFNCGPGHHGSGGQQAHSDHADNATHGGAAPSHSHQSAPVLHSHADEPTVSAADGGGHEAKTPAAHKVTKVSCSACASCCTAAALPTSVLGFDATPVHEAVVPFAPRSLASFLTDGPDRPPRSILV